MKKVAIIMGSDSDLPIVEKGINVLKEYGVPFEVHVYSAHRTPVEAAEFSKNARSNGIGVMIAAAGMAAHLAGAIAANTTLPVIGIPVSCKNTGGMDALLATVQMPSGIPVATVAIAANPAKDKKPSVSHNLFPYFFTNFPIVSLSSKYGTIPSVKTHPSVSLVNPASITIIGTYNTRSARNE